MFYFPRAASTNRTSFSSRADKIFLETNITIFKKQNHFFTSLRKWVPMLRRREFAWEGPSKASCAEALTERRTWQPAVRARCARELEFARVVDLPKASQHLETTGGRGMEQPRRARRIQKKCRLIGANRSTFLQLLRGALSRQKGLGVFSARPPRASACEAARPHPRAFAEPHSQPRRSVIF